MKAIKMSKYLDDHPCNLHCTSH